VKIVINLTMLLKNVILNKRPVGEKTSQFWPQTISFQPFDFMINHTDLSSWKLDLLEKHCAKESKRFYQRKGHDTRFCFEMFRS
jgi:hypothetical protein